jgi:hypothetical protein
VGGLRDFVDFDDGAAGGLGGAFHLDRVGAGVEEAERGGIGTAAGEREGADVGAGLQELGDEVGAVPVVVGDHGAGVFVVDGELGIAEGAGDAEEAADGGTDAAHEERALAGALEGEAEDQHVVGDAGLAEDGDVDEFGGGRGVGIVDFDERNAGGATDAADADAVVFTGGGGVERDEGGGIAAAGGEANAPTAGKTAAREASHVSFSAILVLPR